MLSRSLVLVAFAALTLCALARPNFPDLVPNGRAGDDPSSGLPCVPLGHTNCVPGAPRNPFGNDFKEIGNFEWTKELCMKDSDGDGLTNGEELGDPCCLWTPENKNPPGFRTTQLSHPGIKEDDGAKNAPKCPSDEETTTTTAAVSTTARKIREETDTDDNKTTVPPRDEQIPTTPSAPVTEKPMKTDTSPDNMENPEPKENTPDETRPSNAKKPPATDTSPKNRTKQSRPRGRDPVTKKPISSCEKDEGNVYLAVVPAMKEVTTSKRISSGDAICPSEYPDGFSLICKVPYTARSVDFFVDGECVKTEKFDPYCIAGDSSPQKGNMVIPWDSYPKDGAKVACETDKGDCAVATITFDCEAETPESTVESSDGYGSDERMTKYPTSSAVTRKPEELTTKAVKPSTEKDVKETDKYSTTVPQETGNVKEY